MTPVSPNYDSTAKTLHWLVAALLAGQFVTAALLPSIKMDTPPDAVISLHFSLGIVIVVVMVGRIAHRCMRPVAVAPGMPHWERRLAGASQLAFYALLIVVPFLGWAAASARSVPVRLFGLIALPDIASRKAPWALLAGGIHSYAMWTLLGLVALHAAAALVHHVVLRDDVLRRMLPRGRGGV